MIRINLYKKQNVDMNLLIGSYEKERWNMPFYNTNITLWKGVDNTIEFSIRNHDRKAEKLKEKQFLRFVAINNELQQIICKKMDIVNANTGRYSVTITKDELNDLDEGHFIGHVSIVTPTCEHPEDEEDMPCHCHEDLLYSGLDWNPNFDVEIKPNTLRLMKETVILTPDDFVMDTYQDYRTGKTYQQFTSSIIKSDVTPNHTFVIKLKDFDGVLKIQGSNQETPQSEIDDWFIIEEKSYEVSKNEETDFDSEEDIDYCYCDCDESCDCGCYYLPNYEPVSGLVTFNAELNSLWVRVQYIRELDNPSTVEEVQYRN